jgi:hypothetical protein
MRVLLDTGVVLDNRVLAREPFVAASAAVRPLIEAEEDALQVALDLIRATSCALLCYDGSVQACHRLAVAEALAPSRRQCAAGRASVAKTTLGHKCCSRHFLAAVAC